jgi:hypothetical protein
MRLHQQLILNQARLKDVRVELSNKDPRITVGIRTKLTHEVAEAFGCRELIFAGSVPRSGFDKVFLEGEEVDCEFRLQNDNFSFTATADSVGHYVARLEGEGPVLLFKVKMLGYAGILTDLVEKVKLDPLEVTLKPAQESLDLQGAQKTADSGTLVEPTCTSCEAGVSLLDGTLMHADGNACIARQAATAAAQEESVRPADGAPPKRGRGRPRKVVAIQPEPEADAETEDEADFIGRLQ